MYGQADVRRVRAHFDRQTDFGNKVAGIWPNNTAADNTPGFFVEQQLGKSFVTSQG